MAHHFERFSDLFLASVNGEIQRAMSDVVARIEKHLDTDESLGQLVDSPRLSAAIVIALIVLKRSFAVLPNHLAATGVLNMPVCHIRISTSFIARLSSRFLSSMSCCFCMVKF